jgi:hypothetical protein
MRPFVLRAASVAAALLLAAAMPLASAETVQKGNVRVAFDGEISPRKLPRTGSAPVRVAVAAKISAAKGATSARLTGIAIAINRYGRLDAAGLPVCRIEDIQPATTEKALRECRDSLVGQGQFAATTTLSKQGAFPSQGKLYAFSGTYKGRPAILAHVYGTEPVPTSFTLPFVISKSKGTFGTVLKARIPASEDSFITDITLNLQRSFTYKGQKRSYASASCPAPRGFRAAVFAFARATFAFAKGPRLNSTLTRSCRVG